MQLLLYWRRCSLLLTCLLGLSVGATAQKKPLPGYVITTGGDTLLGAIYPTDPLTQQYKVEFVPLQGTQRHSLDGYQLTSYTYFKDLDTVRFISLPFQKRGSTISRGFLQQVAAGEAQLYYYNSSITLQWQLPYTPVPSITNLTTPSRGIPTYFNPGYYTYTMYSTAPPHAKYPTFSPLKRRGFGRNPARTLVIYRENENHVAQVSTWKFPQDAVTYFSDCPELVADLKAGRYRYRDIPQIVRRYNTWHLTQKPTP
ncbi:hypothetical protein SAMN00120144_1330 [Hymenobacter roseosalivarius DSM 11622]|uniref:Uncharacterized protein n=1 Tax=Hymenobacter roseosalivarius DSM 11622 TaxID=645990 RepID=A0A1W1W4Q7_9BACT|nr:hypothetical protein [Hymenobacter roseosalivarius]SMC00576.1 hypothetical protein SAMN00120144_1330 [Hymenobacter roseosalivarius DSM 11622]